MTKNDLEVLIFHLLRTHGGLKNKSNYEMSLILQIPESKVKRLAYEATLRYVEYDRQIITQRFFECIREARFKGTGSNITFIIDDKYLRSAIDSDLKGLGHFTDTSFNREIVSINIDAFADLLNKYYPDKATEHIVKSCKDALKKEQEGISFKALFKDFLTGAASKSGEIAASSIFAAISGGATATVELIDIINVNSTKCN